MMHIGVDTMLSKTEATYFPPPRVDYSNANTTRFDIRNADGSSVGFVDFTKEFKYLGSTSDSSLTSDADVDMRIKAATSAFAALKNVITSLSVDLRVKGRIYNALVLTLRTLNVSHQNGSQHETPHHIQELVRAPRRRFF